MKETVSDEGYGWGRYWPCLLGAAVLLAAYGALVAGGFSSLAPLFFGCLLLGAALEDGMTGYISDFWSLLLLGGGFLTSVMEGRMAESLLSFLLAAAVYGGLYFFSKKSLGTGDILLSAGAASWLAPLSCLLFIWLSALMAAFVMGTLVVLGKWRMDRAVRFGPFLAAGGLLAYGWQAAWGIFPLSTGFPFG